METLRWIAVLPGAIAAAMAVSFIASVLSVVSGIPQNAWTFNAWTSTVPPIFSGMAFVYAGALIAPRAKYETGTKLAILFGGIGVAFTAPSYSLDNPWMWTRCVAIVFGAYCGHLAARGLSASDRTAQ